MQDDKIEVVLEEDIDWTECQWVEPKVVLTLAGEKIYCWTPDEWAAAMASIEAERDRS